MHSLKCTELVAQALSDRQNTLALNEAAGPEKLVTFHAHCPSMSVLGYRSKATFSKKAPFEITNLSEFQFSTSLHPSSGWLVDPVDWVADMHWLADRVNSPGKCFPILLPLQLGQPWQVL